MKKIFAFGAALLLAPAALTFAEVVEPSDYDSSDCKRDYVASSRSYFDEEENWKLSYADGKLSVDWINLEANCCPEEAMRIVAVAQSEDTVRFYVETGLGMCDCICIYDVTSTFDGFEPGIYTFQFGYWTGSPAFEVELKEGLETTFKAPSAAIKVVEDDSDLMAVTHKGLLTVKGKGEEYVVEIIDMAGIIQTRYAAKGDSEFDLSALERGVYIACMTAGKKTETIRFMR